MARVAYRVQELVHQRDPGRQQQDERIFELEQENARLKAELEQHGAGKCCTMGKTYTRPEFHIDPDDY